MRHSKEKSVTRVRLTVATGAAAAFFGAIFVAPATFADDAESAWSLDGYVGAVTDYRDRGISLSGKDITATGSLSLFHDSGFYGGVDLALVDDSIGDGKTEFFAGYTFDNGDYIYDLSFELDGIHGDTSDYYPEIKASISRDFGLAYIRGGLAFAPDGRWSSPDVDSWYMYTDLEIPVPTLSEVTFISHLGYDMRDGRSDLWDWSVGFSVFVKSFELSLAYEDSSLDDDFAKGNVTAGIKFYF